MRVATFNLMNGRSLADGLVDEARLRDSLASLHADVIGLQEVDRDQPRSNLLDLTRTAARALGAPEDGHRFAAAVVGTPGLTYRPAEHDWDGTGEPTYGVALVSRWPVRRWQVHRLRPAPVRSPVYLPGPRRGMIWLHDEPRVVLAAVIEAPQGPFTVATTHLSFVPGWNLRQLLGTLRWLRRFPAPRILLGDLNLPAGVTVPLVAAAGWRQLARQATYPAPAPQVQLDHVLAHPRAAFPAGLPAQSLHLAVSDHRALLVDLPAEGGTRF
ncbi:MAG TPA: endonuclease/exonuclease/phosphatase family protein [Micromonosporaceae bacterium]